MAKKYKISVITPYHNIDKSLFENTFKSMKDQTFGFSNIEWVIILHNCDKEHREYVKQLAKPYKNIVLKELNNEFRTPSSPRNVGLKLVHGDYIGFLDGDDVYKPDCIEVVYKNALETQSELVQFRREYITKADGLNPLTEIILWNQMHERIILEKGQIDNHKMFTGTFGMVTSRLFKRELLNRGKIHFDLQIPFCEDMLFVLETTMESKRTCILPQYIGYTYVVNPQSIVQNQNIPASQVMAFGKGFARLFQKFQDFGIEDERIQFIANFFCYFIKSCPSLTMEQRMELKEMFGPFLINCSMLKPDKINNVEQVQQIYNIPRLVLLDPQGYVNQKRNYINGWDRLQAILYRNKDTDIGKAYGFKDITSIEAYQKKVKIMTREDLDRLVALQTKIGETNILVPNTYIKYLKKADGQLIPSTPESMKPIVNAFASLLKGHHNFLLSSELNLLGKTNDGGLIYHLDSALIHDYFTHYQNRLLIHDATFSSPIGTYLQTGDLPNYFQLFVDALCDTKIDQIVSISVKQIKYGFMFFMKKWKEMIPYIRIKNPKRAAYIQKVLSLGFNKNTAKKLWPNLKRISAYGADKSFLKSKNYLMQYFDGISWNNSYPFVEEGINAVAEKDNSDIFILKGMNNFVEFMDEKSEDVFGYIDKLVPGKTYKLVLTTDSGLYRYVTPYSSKIISVKDNIVKFKIIS